MSTVAQRVKDLRYVKGLGPDELATKASISRTALYQIESGRTEVPRASTLKAIASALEVPVSTLLTGDNWPTPTPRPSLKEVVTGTTLPSLEAKLHEILESPYGDHMERIIDETHRLVQRSKQTA